MKLLCLHGYGTSGEIFEQQLSGIISAVGRHHEWHFMDGEVAVSRSALAEFIPGRHLVFYDGYDPAKVSAAFEQLTEEIEQHGPFDAVVGYSQGASFPMAYMLQQLIDEPDKPMPFKFAVFFGPGFCLAPHGDYREKEVMGMLGHLTEEDGHNLHAVFLSRKFTKKPQEFQCFKKMPAADQKMFAELMDEVQAMLATREVFFIEESATYQRAADTYGARDFPRFFNPVYTPERVSIPTVHIRGALEDPAPKRLAEICQGLCDPAKVIEVILPGVHEIPRQEPAISNIARAIEKAHLMSQMTSIV